MVVAAPMYSTGNVVYPRHGRPGHGLSSIVFKTRVVVAFAGSFPPSRSGMIAGAPALATAARRGFQLWLPSKSQLPQSVKAPTSAAAAAAAAAAKQVGGRDAGWTWASDDDVVDVSEVGRVQEAAVAARPTLTCPGSMIRPKALLRGYWPSATASQRQTM
ncbi:hypothetical protein JDV02_001150 [Purpureocillium takamizusanense]|uniref:Uncharacterized protein n=1 Tax=Purpureocillium takamizusanense TaxID=2060973 RepID=A0A9Q8Q869_9HYPO|nr:uncharacterized protein JDV02_001150 [Purpureocillium takamizusanense]UNI14532.1 hypothetical protein JDV02_001150 [Purpureocillium takamizusanense]